MLVATHGIKLALRHIDGSDIRKVAAGADLLVAITADHRIRHIARNPDLQLREQYWTRVVDVAISGFAEGMCVGLIADGTCMLSKRALRSIATCYHETLQSQNREFERINNTIKSWTNVIQLAVSDAIFALHEDGTVSCCEFSRPFTESKYRHVQSWCGIRKVVVGSQDSIVGITDDGQIRVDGYNLLPRENEIVRSGSRIDAVDVVLGGSECERILFLDREGYIRDMDGNVTYPGTYTDVLGNWDYTLLARDAEQKLHVLDAGCYHIANEGECESWGRVSSYAILNQEFGKGAVVAVCAD